MNKETGGPAFPIDRIAVNKEFGISGMTMRDYFAAKAMMAYMTHERGAVQPNDVIADGAYAVADAMIKERNK